MVWKLNLHQLTSLVELKKALEAHGYISRVSNLSIAPHTLDTLTANITCCIILLEYVK